MQSQCVTYNGTLLTDACFYCNYRYAVSCYKGYRECKEEIFNFKAKKVEQDEEIDITAGVLDDI
jgi:hypothetical protein